MFGTTKPFIIKLVLRTNKWINQSVYWKRFKSRICTTTKLCTTIKQIVFCFLSQATSKVAVDCEKKQQDFINIRNWDLLYGRQHFQKRYLSITSLKKFMKIFMNDIIMQWRGSDAHGNAIKIWRYNKKVGLHIDAKAIACTNI